MAWLHNIWWFLTNFPNRKLSSNLAPIITNIKETSISLKGILYNSILYFSLFLFLNTRGAAYQILRINMMVLIGQQYLNAQYWIYSMHHACDRKVTTYQYCTFLVKRQHQSNGISIFQLLSIILTCNKQSEIFQKSTLLFH